LKYVLLNLLGLIPLNIRNHELKPQIQRYTRRIALYSSRRMTLSLGLFLIGILMLSCLSYVIFNQQNQALAQQYIQTIKFRNLDINLGNGVKTNAQLTFPAI
jgi:hypothetical protein